MQLAKTKLKLFALLIFISTFGLAQSESIMPLNPDAKTTKSFTHGETHIHTIELEANQYVYFQLMQKDIDLKINVEFNEKEIGEFDSPNYRNGAEPITFTTESEGMYHLKVTSIDADGHKGDYEIEVLKIADAATTNEGRVDQLFTVYDSQHTPGAAVAIVSNGSVIYKNGYGMSNLEYDIPISPSTVFHIASVSKQFTAFALLLLEKDGKLSLDDDIRTYIPEVPDFGETITLRHLANHTSGLRDQWNLLALAGWQLDDVITKEHIMKLVERQKELNFKPGEEYLYCNTGFTLMAEVVARVSGKSFAEFTKDRIFGPLEMNNTLFYDDHEKIVKNRAYSYYSDQ